MSNSSSSSNNGFTPISWRPGSKVANSSQFGSAPSQDDLKYAPKPDQDTPNVEADPIDILKQKREERKAEETTKPSASHEVETPKKLTPPHFKETPAPAPEEVEDEEKDKDEEDSLENEDAEEKAPTSTTTGKKSSSIPFYIILVILLAGIGYGAQLLIEQSKTRVDIYGEKEREHKAIMADLADLQAKDYDNQQEKLKLAHIKLAEREIADIKLLIQRKEEQQVALIQQIQAKKEEMLAYYKRYKAFTQRQAKDLYLDELITQSGRQFHEVTVTRANDRQISITHASGATSIPYADLPIPIQDRLGYTNPFADVETSLKATNDALKKVSAPISIPIVEESTPGGAAPAPASQEATPPAAQPRPVVTEEEDTPAPMLPEL